MKSTTFHRVQSRQSGSKSGTFMEIRSLPSGKVLSLNSEVYRTAKSVAASALTQPPAEKQVKSAAARLLTHRDTDKHVKT